MRAVWVLPLVGGPILASCAFLLDFDSLQSGGADASVGGNGATGGSSAGGTAGSSAGGIGGIGFGGTDSGVGCTPEDAAVCDDGDPCTADTCVAPDGGKGQCVSIGKLYEDGDEILAPVPNLVRITATGGNGRFYFGIYTYVPPLSALAQVHSIPATGQFAVDKSFDFQLIAGTSEAGPRSAPGLIAANGGLTAFVAYEKGITNWTVKQVEFKADLTSPIATDICTAGQYNATIDGIRYPTPFIDPGSQKPGAVWIGPNGIWFGNKDAHPGNYSIPGKPGGVSPMLTDTNVGALWWDEGTKETYVSVVNGGTKPVVNCSDKAAKEGPVSAGVGRLWLSAIHRYNLAPESTNIEWSSFICQDKDCYPIGDCNDPDNVTADAELPGLTGFTRGTPDPGFDRVHFASAVPFGAALAVNVTYTEISKTGTEFQRYGVFAIDAAIPKLGPSTKLERPAIAFADDRLLVAWIEKNAAVNDAGTPIDVLRAKRFKFCP